MGKNASPQMAPDLPFVVRKILEREQVPFETIQAFLKENPSITRYNPAFKHLWGILQRKGLDPWQATSAQVVSGIMELCGISLSTGRNAYSAMLLIPGYNNIRFHPLLSPKKKKNGTIPLKNMAHFGIPAH